MGTNKEIALRFTSIREAKKLKQSEFAAALGLSRPTVSGLENGTATLSDRNIKIVCETYNVNEKWLRDGKGDMFNPPPNYPNKNDNDEILLLDMFRKLSAEMKAVVLSKVRQLLALDGSWAATPDTMQSKLDNKKTKKRA